MASAWGSTRDTCSGNGLRCCHSQSPTTQSPATHATPPITRTTVSSGTPQTRATLAARLSPASVHTLARVGMKAPRPVAMGVTGGERRRC